MTQRAAALEEVIALMARLRAPDGCPWDREQTFDSIKRHTLEETYEVFDAIDRKAWPDLRDELGDLLLQVLFYSQMAEEAGLFSITDVAAGLNAKLVRRHPHVFGDATAHTSEDVNRTWEAVKRMEKSEAAAASFLDAVPQYLPAVLEAEKLGARAAGVGFDWPSAEGLLDKLAEEAAEVRMELEAAEQPGAAERTKMEIGDLLFTAVNLARHVGVSPEFALRAANVKFRRRFQAMEEAAGGELILRAVGPDELERLWALAKQRTG